ncbi:MAG: hypothetical protein SGI90_16320 [Candidatus Eisenbacteria bacterium]|nr:hypothetical protein [Candidatus Eisenbacteria bacterium]
MKALFQNLWNLHLVAHAATLLTWVVVWPAVGHAQVLGPETRITQTPGRHDFEPTIAANGNTVVAVWSLGSTTRWSATIDGGNTWSVGALLPSGPRVDYVKNGPTVCATAGGRFFIAVTYFAIGARLPCLRTSAMASAWP